MKSLSYLFLHFLLLEYIWLETTFWTVQKWSLRPLLDGPKGGLNIGILLYLQVRNSVKNIFAFHVMRPTGNLTGQNLLPGDQIYLFLSKPHFRRGSVHPGECNMSVDVSPVSYSEGKEEVIKNVALPKNARKSTKCRCNLPVPLKVNRNTTISQRKIILGQRL